MSEAGSTTETETKEQLKNELERQLIRAKRNSAIFIWTYVVANSLLAGFVTVVVLLRMIAIQAIDLPLGMANLIGIAVTLVGYCIGLLITSFIRSAIDTQARYSSLQ